MVETVTQVILFLAGSSLNFLKFFKKLRHPWGSLSKFLLCLGFVFQGALGFADSDPRKITFLRDAEIEDILKSFILPLFKVAGLNADSLKFFIILDNQINAAAGAGSVLFLNSGFLLAADSAAQVVGVLAHETGHIAGGHVARMEEAFKDHTMAAMAVAALGIAGGLASSHSDIAMAGVLGAMQVGERSVLYYTRTQESAADQAGIDYLHKLRWPVVGLLEFMKILHREEFLDSIPQNAYTRTHPLTQERIQSLQSHLEKGTCSFPESLTQKKNQPQGPLPALPDDFEPRFARLKAKMFAFCHPPRYTLRQYKGNSIADLYAQAIAYHRDTQPSKALKIIDDLITKDPKDAYFWDLKGQVLLEGGDLKGAREAYTRAIKLLPDNALIHIDLARTLLALENPQYLEEAIVHLNLAQKTEPMNSSLWRHMSIAYGRKGDMGMMALCLSEEAFSNGDFDASKVQAERAIKFLKPNTQRYRRALDIKNAANEELSS